MLNLNNIRAKKIKIFLFLILIFFSFKLVNFKDKNEVNEKNDIKNITQKILVKKIFNEPYSKKIILRGNTESSRTVIIKAQVEGKISSVNFKKGNFVKAGKQIILIDPEDKIAKSKEMEALLDQRKKEYEVAEKLFKKGYRSEVRLSESRTKFENSLALYEKSQVELNNTKILIPFDSFLEESYIELGDYVKKGDKVAKVVDLDPMYLTCSATEKEVINLVKGQAGVAKLSNGEEIEGFINYISSSANKKTRNFIVQLEVKNSEKKILDGISGEIHINLKKQNAFFVPSSVITLNEIGQVGIKIVENKKVRFKKIEILSDTGEGYWIKNDNKDYVDLVILGQDYVLDGEIVNPTFSK